MPPWMGGGEMIQEVQLLRTTYAEPPLRFEAGTPAIAQAIGLGYACDYLTELGMTNVRAYEEELAALLYEEVRSRLGDNGWYRPPCAVALRVLFAKFPTPLPPCMDRCSLFPLSRSTPSSSPLLLFDSRLLACRECAFTARRPRQAELHSWGSTCRACTPPIFRPSSTTLALPRALDTCARSLFCAIWAPRRASARLHTFTRRPLRWRALLLLFATPFLS